MTTETAQKKFGEWLLEWGDIEWNQSIGKHWTARHIKYTGKYTTAEMFEFFKKGKKWTDE